MQMMIDAAATRFFLTHSGYVALECDGLGAADEAQLFGPEGAAPPRRISDLVAETLETLAAAPDPSDAAGLKVFARDLKASLALVETVLARLES